MNTAIETRSQIEIAEEKVHEKIHTFSSRLCPLLKESIQEQCNTNPFSRSNDFIALNHFIAKRGKVPFKYFSEEEINALFIGKDSTYYEVISRRKLAIERFSLDRRISLKGYFSGIAAGLFFNRTISLSGSFSIQEAADCFIDYIILHNLES